MSCLNKYLLLLLLSHLLCGHSIADASEHACDRRLVEILGKRFTLPDFSSTDEGGRIVAQACKVWPYNPDVLLAALAYKFEPSSAPDWEYKRTLLLATVDLKKSLVLASHRATIEEDAVTEIGPYSFSFDTARYQLADRVRAFGLRFNSSAKGPSCGEASWGDKLTLLVPEGDQLRPVLAMQMSFQRSKIGCLSVLSQGAVWETARLTATVMNTRTNGFRDILVQASITTDSNDQKAKLPKPRTERRLLRYNGTSYEFGPESPWWLANL